MLSQYGCVNARVRERLSVDPPSNYLIQSYLQEIATNFNVDWKPSSSLNEWCAGSLKYCFKKYRDSDM